MFGNHWRDKTKVFGKLISHSFFGLINDNSYIFVIMIINLMIEVKYISRKL